MSLDTLAEIFGLAPPNDSRQLSLSCARCLSQITATERSDRIVLTCCGGCTEDELIGALAEVEPAFADWWLSGGLTDGEAGRTILGEKISHRTGAGGGGVFGSAPRTNTRDPASVTGSSREGTPEALERPESHDSDENGGDAHRSVIPGRDNARAAGLDEAGGSAETQTPRQTLGTDEASVSNDEEDQNEHPEDSEPHLNGQVSARRPDLQSWKMMLYALGQQGIEKLIAQGYREAVAVQELDAFVAQVEKLRNLPKIWQTNDPLGLSESEIGEELQTVAVALRNHYAPAVIEPDAQPPRAMAIEVEDAAHAIVSNAEYLSHAALVDRLYYTHHASLHVGGKHEGKTTCVKTEALALATGGRGLYGRGTMQTPVIYAASEDEYPSVRMDLLRMGWNPAMPLKMVRISNDGDREFVLEDIAKVALQMGAYFVVLDMLFDFARVHDEIAYAETREAMGKVVDLAIAIKGHIKATHHSPKWLPDAAAASKAALGSQGIAARFSPILLSKMWVAPKADDPLMPGLFTIESTMTRDPRGLAVPITLVTRDEMGWVVATKEFTSAMKWPTYVRRIQDYFEMSEPGKWFTVNTVAREIAIPRPECQNAMLRMTMGDKPLLERMKRVIGQGGGYTYRLLMHPSTTTSSVVESEENSSQEVVVVDDTLSSYNYNFSASDSAPKAQPQRSTTQRPKSGQQVDQYGIPLWK